jgi:hypothetical protein
MANLSTVLLWDDLTMSGRMGVPPGERSMPCTRFSWNPAGTLSGEPRAPAPWAGWRAAERRSCTLVMSASDTLSPRGAFLELPPLKLLLLPHASSSTTTSDTLDGAPEIET